MAKTLTFWVSPVQGNAPQAVAECVARARAATPKGWTPRVLIPAVYGSIWQASSELSNTCGMEIRPMDAPDLRWVADRFAEAGCLMGAWGVPRDLTYSEGQAHGWAASVAELYCLDVEPYPGFLVENDRCVADFIAGFRSACDRAPWISLVPQLSGIDTLGNHLWEWLTWCAGVRTQNYFTDSGGVGTALDYPHPSGDYILETFRRAGVKRKVVPMFPSNGGAHTAELLAQSLGGRDIWTI